MADHFDIETVDDDVGYDYDTTKIPEIVTPDDMNESGYQEGSEQSYGDRRDSKEGFGGEGDSDSGVDGVSSGCSTADDCPVVSINDVVAYYDDIRPRRRYVPQLNFYNVDIERMAMDAIAQVTLEKVANSIPENEARPGPGKLDKIVSNHTSVEFQSNYTIFN